MEGLAVSQHEAGSDHVQRGESSSSIDRLSIDHGARTTLRLGILLWGSFEHRPCGRRRASPAEPAPTIATAPREGGPRGEPAPRDAPPGALVIRPTKPSGTAS